MEKRHVNLKAFHLAGIVPVAGQPLDFSMPWSDCLMPIASNYTLIERAVVEAVNAGCETIWIICNDDMAPLIKHRLGEWIRDPVYVKRKLWQDKQRKIPIFYVPISPKDLAKRDCLAWSVLYGAWTAYMVGRKLSKWVVPDRFYVAFPYGVYPEDTPREHRRAISNRQGFYLSHNGKTVRDGEYLGFTFTGEELKEYKRHFRKEANGVFRSDLSVLPVEERYSGRWFSLDKVFGIGIMEGSLVADAPWYYNVDDWNKYCTYLGSEERKLIVRPESVILSYREWRLIGVDNA